MKKLITVLAICVLFLILDNTLVPFFAVKGYFPNLLLLFVICYSIVNGSWEGIWVGILSGILQDIYFYNGFGINTLTNMLVCVAAGFIGNGIFKEKSLIPIVSSFILSFAKGVLAFAVLYIVKQYTPFKHILFDSIYTTVVSIFMYRWVYKLCQKEYMQRKWSFYDR